MTRPIRALLVEDNPADAELTKETLESGRLLLDVSVASDGAAALRRLLGSDAEPGAEPPDLILLDLNLPGVSGREVLAQVKSHPHLRKIPVVILTSSDAEEDIHKSYDLGAACYVAKPIGLQAFQETVRSIEGFWFTIVRFP